MPQIAAVPADSFAEVTMEIILAAIGTLWLFGFVLAMSLARAAGRPVPNADSSSASRDHAA